MNLFGQLFVVETAQVEFAFIGLGHLLLHQIFFEQPRYLTRHFSFPW
jgi:hypothetical protein